MMKADILGILRGGRLDGRGAGGIKEKPRFEGPGLYSLGD